MKRIMQWKRGTAALLTAVLCCAGQALAEPDSFWLGTGRDGPLTVSTPGFETNRYAQVVAPSLPGDTDIDVGSVSGFAAGDLVMIHQTTGLVPAPDSGSATNVELANSPVGRWEFARVSSVSGNVLRFTAPLLYSYAASVSQVVRVPEYTSVTVASSGSIVAPAWNGQVGGILAFLVQNSVTNDGSISATGAGFRGGTYVQDTSGSVGCTGLNELPPKGAQRGEGLGNTPGSASTGRGNVGNAGGGGICFKSGGGGGGSRGKGGQGGSANSSLDPRGVGGLSGAPVVFDPYLRLVFGGGGGSGHGNGAGASAQNGSRGGGIVLIRANQLLGAGIIEAEGGDVSTEMNVDAGGGGGGGGTVLARFVGSAACNRASVMGGNGGYTNGTTSAGWAGPGGGGGGGYVRVQGAGGTCNVRATGGSQGYVSTSSTLEPYGAATGSLGAAERLSTALIRPAVPTLNEPVPGLVTNWIRPAVKATYSGPGTALLGIFVDGIESGFLTCDSSGLCSGNVGRDLAAGSHQITVAVRVDGLWSAQTAARTLEIDLSPPAAPVVTSPTPGAVTNDQLPLVQGTAEALSTVEILIDGKSLGTAKADSAGAWSFKPTTLVAQGTRSLQVRATDVAGNTGALSSAISFVIDATPPARPVVVSPVSDSSTNVVRPTIQGTAEAGSTVIVLIDDRDSGGVPVNASGAWSLVAPADLANGSHTVKATARDAAGNVSAVSATTTFTVDTVRPDTTITVAPSNPSRFTSTSFSFSSSEAGSFECSLDDAAFTACTSPFAVSGLGNGTHKVQVRAKDTAGNVDESPAAHTWTVDTVPPVAPVVTSPSPGGYLASLAFAGTAEAGSTVTVRVDGSNVGTAMANAIGAWSLTSTSSVSDGTHTVDARAEDAAGNASALSASVTFQVDTAAPDTNLTSNPTGVVNSASATLTFTSEAGVTFECNLDGAGFAACSSPLNLEGLVDGTHTFEVRARDRAGNVDATPATASWVSDTGAPTVSITAGPSGATNATSATFSFSSNEFGATFECSLDGGAFAACSNPVTFPSLAGGEHTLMVRARDAVGTLSETATRTWTVDTLAPDTTITQKPEAQTQETSAIFAFQSETGATFECSLDMGTYAACSSPVTYSDLVPGNHTFSVRAKDVAGNVDATPASHSWAINRPTSPGGGGEEEPTTGCACSASGFDPSMSVMALAGLAAFVSRRRRK